MHVVHFILLRLCFQNQVDERNNNYLLGIHKHQQASPYGRNHVCYVYTFIHSIIKK